MAEHQRWLPVLIVCFIDRGDLNTMHFLCGDQDSFGPHYK